jgi:hypothetical protein
LLTLQVDGTHGSAVAGLRRCFTRNRASTRPKPVWNPDIAQPIDFFVKLAGDSPDNSPPENAFKAEWGAVPQARIKSRSGT